jgi:hypothetical protein
MKHPRLRNGVKHCTTEVSCNRPNLYFASRHELVPTLPFRFVCADMQPVNVGNCGGDEGEEQNQEYDENLDTYPWYSYQLTEEQSNDAAKVCQAVKNLSGGHSTVYDKKNSGTLYKYKSKSKNGMRPGGVAALVVFLVLVAGAAAAFVMQKRKQSDRKIPLINAGEGTMA